MPGIPLPDGYHAVNTYVVTDDPEGLIRFLAAAFGGIEHERISRSDGHLSHAEVRIGDSLLMLGQSMTGHPAKPAYHYVYVDDVDEVHRRALAAGATSVMEPADQFYGDRSSGVTDPQGNTWYLATHLEDVAPAELQRRAEEYERAMVR
jgi:PhnB protein